MRVNYAKARGSIYVLTLLTVAAVGSMVMIGVMIRNASNVESGLIETVNENGSGVLTATEYAIQRISQDPKWNQNAQKSTVFSDLKLGGRTYSCTVLDADTGEAVKNSTTRYLLTVESSSGLSDERAEFVYVREKLDYHGFLQEYDLQHNWPLTETDNPSKTEDLEGDYTGEYLDPSVAGQEMNDEGGYVPLFQDDNDHVEIPWGSSFKQSQASMSMWVKLTGRDGLKPYGILGMLYQNRGDRAPSLSLYVLNNTLIAYLCDDGQFSISNITIGSSKSFTPDEWHHIVLTWHHNNGFKMYLDGNLLQSNLSNRDGTSTSLLFGGYQPMLIGGGYSIYSSSWDEIGFEGSVAHVALFDLELKAKEVQEIAEFKPDLTKDSMEPSTWARVYE